MGQKERSARWRAKWTADDKARVRKLAKEAYHAKHEQYKKKHRRWTRKRKLKIFEAYGGPKCALCPETRIGCLHLDHVSGDGAEHRKAIGGANATYAWIIKNNFPAGFRVLCANCNHRQWLLKLRSSLSDSAGARHQRQLRERCKLELMRLLGAACTTCSLDDVDVLTVHHINNDGAEHRKQVSGSYGGHKFYRAVLKSGDLTGLECRCFSCNDLAAIEKEGNE